MCMVYENLRSAKVSKSFPRRALTGKLIEDTFLHFEIKNGFYLYVYRKNNQGQPFFQNHSGYTYYQEMGHKNTHIYII